MADFAILSLKTHLDLGSIKVLVSQIFDILEIKQHQIFNNVLEVPNLSTSLLKKLHFVYDNCYFPN